MAEMNPSKYTTYELKLEGGPKTIALLKDHLPATYATMAAANAKRRAILELFGEVIGCKVISVRRIPAKTIRRAVNIP